MRRPLSVRNDPNAVEEYETLVDGIPPWIAESMRRWVNDIYSVLLNDQRIKTADRWAFIEGLEHHLRIALDRTGGSTDAPWRDLERRVANQEDLDVVDGLLLFIGIFATSVRGFDPMVSRLDHILHAGGSGWTVGEDEDGRPSLVRRVDPTVEAAATVEFEQAGNAGKHLRRAWHGVYGRDPNASDAYREAVRAVEAAAKPVVIPEDSLATLGKMIRAMQDKPSKWTTEIGTVEQLTGMMQSLWTSQLDRHGTDDESHPLSVTLAQAEAAVHFAVTLVHWFRTGAVAVSPS